jgi:hypothetical protein
MSYAGALSKNQRTVFTILMGHQGRFMKGEELRQRTGLGLSTEWYVRSLRRKLNRHPWYNLGFRLVAKMGPRGGYCIELE